MNFLVFFLITVFSYYLEAKISYPSDFMWGAAFSAHQTEGSVAGGGTQSDWYKFEHTSKNGKPNIKNGDTSEIATDHWNRFPEDIKLASDLGLRTLRTSVAWEKIEPRKGEFNHEVILHYRKELQTMLEFGIKPMLALHHFVHPLWFHENGGWTNPESSKWFLEYANYVVQNLGDLCEIWITFNEPVIQVSAGYIAGVMPPLKHNPWKAMDVAWNMARAHRRVADMIHRVQGRAPNARGSDGLLKGVGIAQSTQYFEPFDPQNKNDIRVASQVDELVNWAFLKSIDQGRLKFELPRSLASLALGQVDRKFPKSDLPENSVPAFQDWVGVNYYSRFQIKSKKWSPIGLKYLIPEGLRGDNGWALYPDGLEIVLRRAAKLGHPLVVTENGVAASQDEKRQEFLRTHLEVLDRAMGVGPGKRLDIRGYYFWSLIDNFEWLQGYGTKFGLVEVLYQDGLKRVPRPSYKIYREEIESRRRK
jgi:beta-glucosidase